MSSEVRKRVADSVAADKSDMPLRIATQSQSRTYPRRTRTDRPAAIALYRESSRERAFAPAAGAKARSREVSR